MNIGMQAVYKMPEGLSEKEAHEMIVSGMKESFHLNLLANGRTETEAKRLVDAMFGNPDKGIPAAITFGRMKRIGTLHADAETGETIGITMVPEPNPENN